MSLTFAQTLELINKPGNEIRATRRIPPSVYDSDNKDRGSLRKGVLHNLIVGGHVDEAEEGSTFWCTIYVSKSEAERRAEKGKVGR